MDYRKMEEYYDKLCKEIDNQFGKELNAGTLDTMWKLSGVIHYLDEMMKAEDDYSDRYYGRSNKRDNMGRYSRDYHNNNSFRSELERLMERAPDDRTRESISQMMRNI